MIRFLVYSGFLFCFFLYASCVKDNCRDTLCYNDGLCVDGLCACLSGYEGAQCEKHWHEKFTGTWYNEELIADSANEIISRDYRIIVRSEDSAGMFFVDSLAGFAVGIICEISGRYRFNFRTQSYHDSSFYIEGGQALLDTLTETVTGGYTYRLHNRRYSSEMKWTRMP